MSKSEIEAATVAGGAFSSAQEETVAGYRMEVARLGADDPRAVIVVETKQQAHDLGEKISAVKTAIDTLEDIRTSVVGPLNAVVKEANGFIAGVREPLKDWLERAKRAVAAFIAQEEVERRRREDEARRAAEEAARKEEAALAKVDAAKTEHQRTKALVAANQATHGVTNAMAQVQAASTPLKGFKTSSGTSISTREVWDFEIVDVNAVPREWLSVNEPAIRRAVTAGVRTIPGVSIFQRKGVSVR